MSWYAFYLCAKFNITKHVHHDSPVELATGLQVEHAEVNLLGLIIIAALTLSGAENVTQNMKGIKFEWGSALTGHCESEILVHAHPHGVWWSPNVGNSTIVTTVCLGQIV